MTKKQPPRYSDPLGIEFEKFLSRIASDPSRERTARTYRMALYKFHECLSAHKAEQRGRHSPTLALRDLDVRDLDNFQTWLNGQPLSKFTRTTYLAATKSFLTYLLADGRVSDAYSVERAKAIVKQNKKRSAYPVPQPDDRLPEIITYYDHLELTAGDKEKEKRARLHILRARAFVHLLYSSAARLSEVAHLDRKDVQDGRRGEAIVTGKGDKERPIFITPEARTALQAYIGERQDGYEPLFISHGRDYGHRADISTLWLSVKVAAKALGVDISPHDFRHFRARQMLNEGAPAEAIQEILGHSDISTTLKVYAHYSKPSIRAIFDRTTLSVKDAVSGCDLRPMDTTMRD